jgi:hypothetical protein
MIIRLKKAMERGKKWFKTVRQDEFEKDHPEVAEIYSHIEQFQEPSNEKEKAKNDPLNKFLFLIN